MLDLVGIGVIGLVIYVAIILILNVGFKRRASESMMWAFLILVIIAETFSEHPYKTIFITSFNYGIHAEALYAAMAFVFMSFIT